MSIYTGKWSLENVFASDTMLLKILHWLPTVFNVKSRFLTDTREAPWSHSCCCEPGFPYFPISLVYQVPWAFLLLRWCLDYIFCPGVAPSCSLQCKVESLYYFLSHCPIYFLKNKYHSLRCPFCLSLIPLLKCILQKSKEFVCLEHHRIQAYSRHCLAQGWHCINIYALTEWIHLLTVLFLRKRKLWFPGN